MAVNHATIADPNIHEPKGTATATVKEVYVADGAGSGAWQKIDNQSLEGISSAPAAGYFIACDGAGGFVAAPSAHGSIYFSNFSTPYSLAETTAYQKVAATTTVSGDAIAITEGTDSKLTYIGVPDIYLDVVFQASFDQSTGSAKDVYVSIYKNGTLVPGSEIALTTTSGEKVSVACHKDIHVSTNDYIEIYSKVSSNATVNYYTINLFASMAGA